LEHVTTSNSRSIIKINNPNDRYCLARCIYIGLTKINLFDLNVRRITPQEQTNQFREFCRQQETHINNVTELMQNSGIPLDLQEYSLNHVETLQRYVNENVGGEGEIRIVVFKKEQQYQIVFKGQNINNYQCYIIF